MINSMFLVYFAESRGKDSPSLVADIMSGKDEGSGESARLDSPKEKASVVLMPLRRNVAAIDRDFIPSPRRPRTATEEDGARSDSLDLLYGDKDGTKTCTEDDRHTPRNPRPAVMSARRHESAATCQPPPQVGDRRQGHIHRPLVRKSSSWTDQMTDFKVREGATTNVDSTEPHHVPSPRDRKTTTTERSSAAGDAYSSPSHSSRKSALHMAGTSSLRSYGASSPHSSHHGHYGGHNGGQSGHGHSNHHSPSIPDRVGTSAHTSRHSTRVSGFGGSPYHGYDSSSPSRKPYNKTVARKLPMNSLMKGSDI